LNENSAALTDLGDVSADIAKSMYKTMIKIRKFEEIVGELISKKEIVCPCHLCIGQEAMASGICHALQREDYLFSTHRSHGHFIAKGGNINALMAELYCKATGCSKGKGGSMHLISRDLGLPGSSAIVAGTIPLAVGAALAFSIQKKSSVSLAFFGDGATNEGVFYESLNLASLYKLPVIFVCENNSYSTHLHISSCLADVDISKKADAFGMPGIKVDGNNALEIYKEARTAVHRARRGEGPTLIEGLTYRWRGHVGPNYDIDKGLRSRNELNRWMNRCPIKILEAVLIQNDVLSQQQINQIYISADEEINDSISFARNSPDPDITEESFSCEVFTDAR